MAKISETIPKQPNLFCYDEPAKQQQSRAIQKVYRIVQKTLPGFEFKVRFNPGGIAVWGETYAHIYQDGKPVVEAYDTSMGMLVRQWDGRHSGHNHYVQNITDFAALIRNLATKPFVRF